MRMLRICLLCWCWLQFSTMSYADAGVLIPSSVTDQPDPRVLSLSDMQVSILVDNQTARVSVRQVFASHVGQPLEGQYLFAVNPEALVSDFAVWDGPVRIPGIILERKRAENVYNALRLQAIDPGLLQQAEQGEEGGSRASFFSAKIAPIPGYGTKRLELEYTERLPVEQMRSYFYFPLKPRQFQQQSAGHLRIDLTLRSSFRIGSFKQVSTGLPLVLDVQTPNEIRGYFEGGPVTFQDDFSFNYELRSASELEATFFRATQQTLRESGKPITAFELPSQSNEKEPGYFQVDALFNGGSSSSGPTEPSSAGARLRSPSVLYLLFDTSLSIQWDKLERQYEALEKVLYHLAPQDKFQLLLFNSRVTASSSAAVPASPENIQSSLSFLKKSSLSGGTDLKRAIQTALDQCKSDSAATGRIVIFSDGNSTLETLGSRQILNWFQSANAGPGGTARMKIYAYGIGNDCNKILLRDLASASGGIFEYVGETEATDFKLDNFVSHLTADPVSSLRLQTSSPQNFRDIYRSPDKPVFEQGMAHWVGRYESPAQQVSFTVTASRSGSPVVLKKTFDLPAQASEHIFIPRTWAKARVDFLLRKIEMEGEDAESIQEIIQLSRRFKFVTPYTSFLAAPRSLLRPRLIKPGDPILRVRTDPDIRSIQAIFPFGLSKPLRYLSSEQVWQTRFLAPREMVDGVYNCRLILRDKAGRVYQERKSFVIDSRAPTVKVTLDRAHYRSGETIQLRIQSDADTRRIRARLGNLPPVQAQWDPAAKVNSGFIPLPVGMSTGQYAIEVFAEDFAHNLSSAQVMVSVVQ